MARGFLRLFGVRRSSSANNALSADELRTVVTEAGALIPQRHRQMLLSILDLERVTVNDIMIPRQEISAIDISMSWEDILDRLRQTPHTRLPVYDGELDKLVGILHMKRVAQELARGTLARERLLEISAAREPYFVPEGTPLTQQLAQFQRTRAAGWRSSSTSTGDIAGLVTLEDILEEIVGEFTTDPATVTHKDVQRDAAGNWLINASATIRALNRALGWSLPALGPRTLNGLLLEKLETIPTPGTALRIGNYDFEVLQIADNAIPHRVRAVHRLAAGEGRPRASLGEGRRDRLGDTGDTNQRQAGDLGTRQVLTRQNDALVAELDQLAQPLLAMRHRPHLPGESELPVDRRCDGNARPRKLEASASASGRSVEVSAISMPPTRLTNTS